MRDGAFLKLAISSVVFRHIQVWRQIGGTFVTLHRATLFPILLAVTSTEKLPMRRIILLSILVLASTIAIAQSTSPEALFDRGMDAITGVGPSRNDSLGIDYFR